MRQLTAGKIVKYGLIGFVALVFIFPIYWMIVTSLKPNSVIMRLPPQFLPTLPIADHYISVLSDHRFFTFYKNSVIVAVLTTGVTLMKIYENKILRILGFIFIWIYVFGVGICFAGSEL